MTSTIVRAAAWCPVDEAGALSASASLSLVLDRAERLPRYSTNDGPQADNDDPMIEVDQPLADTLDWLKTFCRLPKARS